MASTDGGSRHGSGGSSSIPQPQSLKLIYFNFGGRADAIRLALHVGGVAFEDVRITEETFRQEKAGACTCVSWCWRRARRSLARSGPCPWIEGKVSQTKALAWT